MSKSSSMVYKTLVVGVIILFCGTIVQPCIAVIQKETPKEATVIQGDYNLLANLSMDIGEYIYNNRIDYEESDYKPPGNQTVNVKINFRCPENLKIVLKYEYFARIEDPYLGEYYIFYNVQKTVTIINGSNPPDINKNRTIFIASRPRELNINLRIKVNLTAFEFLGGEWVKIHNDDIFNETTDWVKFWNCRASERTHFLMRLFERFLNLEVFLRIMNLLR